MLKKFLLPLSLSFLFFAEEASWARDIGKLKVGVIFPLSGDLAAYGIDAVAGLKLATEQLISPHSSLQVELLIRDSASSIKIAEENATSLIKEHHVHALIGSVSSAATIAVARIAQRHRVPHIVPFSTASPITRTGAHIFRSCVTDGYQGAVLAKFALDVLQKKRAAILLEEGFSYMEKVAENFRQHLQNHGGTVVEQLTFNPKTMKAVLRKLAARSPDVILLPSGYNVAEGIIKQAEQYRMQANFLGIGDWRAGIVPEASKHFFVTHFFAEDTQLAVAKFTTQFKLKNQRQPSEYAAMTYDALAILVEAVRRARSLRKFPLLANLSRVRGAQGLVGKISLDRNRNAIKPMFVLGFDRSMEKIAPLTRY